jgi:hypothetical protein
MRNEIGTHRAAILIMLVIGLVFYFGHTHGLMWA